MASTIPVSYTHLDVYKRQADYPGVRVSMETKFDGVITPLKIDISTGDVITPREIKYKFNLMLL